MSLSGKELKRLERQPGSEDAKAKAVADYLLRGDDVIIGSFSEFDTLNGGAGDDLLVVREICTVVGGAGADIFYAQDYTLSTFEDFNPAEGDRIQVGYANGYNPFPQVSALPDPFDGTTRTFVVFPEDPSAPFDRSGASFFIPQATFDPSWVTVVDPLLKSQYSEELFI